MAVTTVLALAILENVKLKRSFLVVDCGQLMQAKAGIILAQYGRQFGQ
jgi:hypothetical protein